MFPTVGHRYPYDNSIEEGANISKGFEYSSVSELQSELHHSGMNSLHGSEDEEAEEAEEDSDSLEKQETSALSKKRTREAVHEKVIWTLDEDKKIMEHQSMLGNKWSKIAKLLPGRDACQVKVRFRSLMRAKRWEWSAEEDERLIQLRNQYGSDWTTISSNLKDRSKHAAKIRYRELVASKEHKSPNATSQAWYPSLSMNSLNQNVDPTSSTSTTTSTLKDAATSENTNDRLYSMSTSNASSPVYARYPEMAYENYERADNPTSFSIGAAKDNQNNKYEYSQRNYNDSMNNDGSVQAPLEKKQKTYPEALNINSINMINSMRPMGMIIIPLNSNANIPPGYQNFTPYPNVNKAGDQAAQSTKVDARQQSSSDLNAEELNLLKELLQ